MEDKKSMRIRTAYTVDLTTQITLDSNHQVVQVKGIDRKLMEHTNAVCLDALKYCVSIFLSEWDMLSKVPTTAKKGGTSRKREADRLIHTGRENIAKYPEFDRRFPYMPAYTRRAVIADALGMVSSYLSNHKNWEEEDPLIRGKEPTMGFPSRYELTFYEQERDMELLNQGIIGLKLFDGTSWGWHQFRIHPSEARYLHSLCKTRKMLSPTVELVRGKYQLRFCFEERKELVDPDPLNHRILTIDLGINAAASWCVMSPDGTVHARGVIHLSCEEDRLRRLMNRKRQYQQAGKKVRSIYRMITAANRKFSIETTRKLMEIAVLYDVDCLVFEHLDRNGKKHGRYAERIHMWRARDVQKRLELQAHRQGMRISRVCAWGTSRYAYDGSGVTDRRSVYHWEHGQKRYHYSIATFLTEKQYNCDLSASYNIGARYFLRAYQKQGLLIEEKTPQRTLRTLWSLMERYNGSRMAA